MTALYELTGIYKQLDAALSDEGEEEGFWALVEEIGDSIKIKATNIAMLVRNMEATADAIKEAEGNMAERRKVLERRAQSIRDYLQWNMEKAEILSIECPEFKIAVRKSPQHVVIDDASTIPAEYMKVSPPPDPVPDKKKIIDDLKNGVVIEGCHAEQGQYLSIK